jgi:ABC-2 type transport system permease protein
MMNWIRLGTVTRREVQRFMRIPIQTLISPWISALLYIFIFGYVIGQRINLFDNIDYIDFVLPGILMMNIVTSAFGQASSSLYFHRFTHSIEEMLVSPLSFLEMVLGYIIGAIARAVTVGAGVYVLALFFTSANMAHVGLFLFYAIITSVIFALLGLLVGLWADKFEHLTILQTFVITPLIYVGGVFNSISMLPESLQTISKFNPFFYIVDGLRYAMIDYSESNLAFGAILLTSVALILLIIVVGLFRKGWRLRN